MDSAPTPAGVPFSGNSSWVNRRTHPNGAAALYGGFSGLVSSGCGFLLAGQGELFLFPVPAALPLGHVTTSGVGLFPLPLPAQPGLIGLELLLQAVHVGAVAGLPVELSRGLLLPLVP